MASETLPIGKIHDTPMFRDAVHVAIAPVVADDEDGLAPGDWVALRPGSRELVFRCMIEDAVGVIDPFLAECVTKGQRCYVFLSPNTVVGLRHLWRHPAFDARSPLAERLRVALKEAIRGESDTPAGPEGAP